MQESTNTAPARVLLSVRQFSQRHPAFTQAGMRHLIFRADERNTSGGRLAGNGLKESGAILRCGRKVLIDEERFFTWLSVQNGIDPDVAQIRAKRVAS